MINNFAEITAPLHELRRKGVPFAWTPVHQAAFDRLLEIMSSTPVLRSYSLSDDLVLTTDASEKSIGGVLTQKGHPLLFVSRVLTSSECNYNNVEKEALAVVWAVLRLRQLLLGRHFTLITDNRPLVANYGGIQLPKVASSRMVRWAIILQAYDFSIVHKPERDPARRCYLQTLLGK